VIDAARSLAFHHIVPTMAEAGSPPAAHPAKRAYRGCSNILDYEIRRKLGEGTFGCVLALYGMAC
jgi:hypothetical protein